MGGRVARTEVAHAPASARNAKGAFIGRASAQVTFRLYRLASGRQSAYLGTAFRRFHQKPRKR